MKPTHDFYRKVLRLLLMAGFVNLNKVKQAMRIIRKADSKPHMAELVEGL